MAGSALLKQGQDRRKAILRFIKAYIRKHGFAPSMQEIADGVGLSSKTAVRHHLVVLQEEGKIEMTPGHYRTVRVL